MTLARKHLVYPEINPFYHIINRCVRRGYLCGYDKKSKKDYSHRKQWVVDLLRRLDLAFAINICAYAVLANHYHLVVWIDQEEARGWSRDEVVRRYAVIHSARGIEARLNKIKTLGDAGEIEMSNLIELWRERLMSISWFEKCLNETIARAANREDEVSGRFWQGRFTSQPLLDDAALMTCMAYVDLNPVRAGVADSLQESDFTSIQERLRRYLTECQRHPASSDCGGITCDAEPVGSEEGRGSVVQAHTVVDGENVSGRRMNDGFPLVPFLDETEVAAGRRRLPILRQHYFDLLETTCQIVKCPKRRRLPESIATYLVEFGINPESWYSGVIDYKRRFPTVLGAVKEIRKLLASLEKRCRFAGMAECEKHYCTQ